MEDFYTSSVQYQSDLSEEYFDSCYSSAIRSKREFSIKNAANISLLLYASLMCGESSYASHKELNSLNITPIESTELYQAPVFTSTKDISLPSKKNKEITLRILPSPSYNQSSPSTVEDYKKIWERIQRDLMLKDSFEKIKGNINYSIFSKWNMLKVNKILIQLPFIDSIMQYDTYDDILEYSLFFSDDLELSVSICADEQDLNNVSFSIYHEGELVVSNFISLLELVDKMNSIISKIQQNV